MFLDFCFYFFRITSNFYSDNEDPLICFIWASNSVLHAARFKISLQAIQWKKLSGFLWWKSKKYFFEHTIYIYITLRSCVQAELKAKIFQIHIMKYIRNSSFTLKLSCVRTRLIARDSPEYHFQAYSSAVDLALAPSLCVCSSSRLCH